MSPIPIAPNEWWYKGCFIQKNEHPRLLPFSVFEDIERQVTVGQATTMEEAQKLALKNKVEKFLYGPKVFL